MREAQLNEYEEEMGTGQHDGDKALPEPYAMCGAFVDKSHLTTQQPRVEAHLIPLLCKKKKLTPRKVLRVVELETDVLRQKSKAVRLSKQSLEKSTVSQACLTPWTTYSGY